MSSRNVSSDVFREQLYIQQQEDLKNLIVNGNNPNCFIVKDLECSWGKSTFALNTLPLYKQQNQNKRVLWVTERIEQCLKNADDVNKMFDKDIAGAIVGGMGEEQREEYLQDYDIIFITHERYKRLSRIYNQEERAKYTDNRHLLIIDEKLEMCKEINFSLTKNALLQNEISLLGGNTAVNLYNEIIESPLVILHNITKNNLGYGRDMFSYKKDVEYIDNLIKQFQTLIYSKVKDKFILYQDYEDKEYQTIIEKVEDLRNFYVGQSIMCYDKNSKEIVTYVPNYSMKMWTLENNIILDATASIDKSYAYNSDLFKITYEDKVFKHHKWHLEWANVNSTTHGRNDVYIDFKKTFNNIVEESGENETLVFAKKYDDVRPVSPNSKELEKVNKFKGTVTHKGVINSNNEFELLKNAINSDSNYDDEKSYVLKYLYYSGLPLKNWARDRKGFTNLALEDLKIHEMARGLYQFFKRVNRNMGFDTRLILLTHKKEIADIIASMLNKIDYKQSEEIEDMFIKKKYTKVEVFESMCKELLECNIPVSILELLEQEENTKYKQKALKGIFQKKLFAEVLCMSKSSFRNNIINYQDKNNNYVIKDFFNEYGIEETTQTLKFKGF